MGLTFLMAVGALIGGLDSIFGNRLRLGEKFEEGFLCMGAAAINMAGMICVAPLIGRVLKPVAAPFFRLMGADPAMFGCLFANNMGGYPLAMELAQIREVGLFSGLIVSSMLGATVVYTIPVAFGLIPEEKKELFAKGIMIGMIPMPVGAFVGGLLMEDLPISLLVKNSIPMIGITILLVIGFLKFQRKLLNGFGVFSRGIKILTVFGLATAAFTHMTGLTLIPGISDLSGAMETVVSMCIVQLGSFPLAAIFVRIFRRPLTYIGKRSSMNAVSMAALPIACVNAISMFVMVKDMDERGTVVSAAWMSSIICILTAHFAYTNAVAPQMVAPVMAAKAVSGALAVGIALWMTRKR